MRIIIFLFTLLALQASATTYYVGVNGNDGNNGTSSATAWKTIAKVNSFWASLQPGDQVLFEGGQSFLGTLTPTKAGSSTNYIKVGSWGSGKATLTTLVTVGGWPTFTTPGIYTSSQTISHGSTVPKVIVINNVLQEIGRWPNVSDAGTDAGYLKHTSVSGSSWTDNNYTTFANTVINPVTGNHTFNWVGATSVHRATHFNMDMGAVTAQSGTTFTYTGSASFLPKVGFGYYFINSMQTLDKDGEWYFDPTTNKLSIYASSSLANRTIKIATDGNVINNKYNYITFENLIIEGSNSSNINGNASTSIVQNNIIRFGGDNVRFSGATGPKILNNTISDALNFGIIVKTGSNSLVEGNTITNSGQWSSMGGNGTKENVGISINGGSTTVQYNSVYNSGYANIVVNDADNQITQYNYVSNAMTVMDDGGSIYTIEDGGALSAPRANKIIRGNIIDRPNLTAFHGTTNKSASGNVAGIYMDNYSNGVQVISNTVIGSTMAIYGIRAANSQITNNNIFDCQEKQFLLTDRAPSSVRNNVYTGNNALMTGTSGTPVTFYNNAATVPVKSLASFNNNKYFRPASPGVKFHIDKPDNGITDPTFPQWNSGYSFDLNSSTASPVTTAVNTSNLYKVVFNASRNTQSFGLDNKTWVDVNGTAYKTNTVSLLPYSSVMLMNTPNVAVTGGNQSPTISLTSPANNSTFTAPATVNLTANASDDGGVTKVEFYNGATLLNTDITVPYSFSWTNVTAGPYTIKAIAYDAAGLTASASADISVLSSTPGGPVIEGELKKWHKVTLTFAGPTATEGGSPNPNLDYRLNVTFKHSSGKTYVIPGYFAADGNASETGATSGNKWRVHFNPDLIGNWTYTASFRQGANVAISDVATDGTAIQSIDGQTGTIAIGANDKTGVDLRAKGRLRPTGAWLMQFAETGEYFRKVGTDAPENLLDYADFDNTPKLTTYQKTWTPHVADWKTGDPIWKSTKGKGLIGAVNYLSSVGVNSISFLTMNIGGDDKDVFPYTSTTALTTIDVSKVDQWEIVFAHAEKMGMHLHFKLQETESNNLLDGGALGTQRKLYIREMIARFGHHLALNWNLGEENTQTTQQEIDMAAYIASHDPYKSNVVMHTHPADISAKYTPMLGSASALTGVSIQTDTANVYAETRKWVEASANAGKKWIVANDEQNPAAVGVAADAEYTGNKGTIADNSNAIRRTVLWGNLMAGGAGVEYYYGYSTGETDLTLQDFRSRKKSYGYQKIAADFFHAYLPNNELKPLSNVSTGWSMGTADNSQFVVYLKNGGTTNLTIPAGSYSVRWYNPRTGGALANGSVTTLTSTGAAVSIGNPPSNTGDWVVLVKGGAAPNSAPTATITSPASNTTYTAPAIITITANAGDADGTVKKVDFYSNNIFIGTDSVAPYSLTVNNTPAATYTLTVKATDNTGLTGTSTPVTVVVNGNNAPSVNITSPANNSTFTQPVNLVINATATDADGTVSKVDFYSGGTLLGTDNTSPYSYSLNNAPAGTYSLTAKATDNAGNTTLSQSVNVTVNGISNPPTVSITSPLTNTGFTAPANVTIYANANDDVGINKVEFYNGGTLLGADTSLPYSFTWSNIGAGSYSLTAKAYDNTGLSTTSDKVNISVRSLVSPSVSITSPANNATFITPASIAITANATDPDGTVSKVEFYSNGNLIGTDNTSPYAFTLSNLATGTYNLTAKAYDNDNQATVSALVTITVSKTKIAPTVSLTAPANGSTYQDPTNIDLAATATDQDGTIARVDFYANNILIGSSYTAPYKISYTSVMAGNYSLTATAIDNDSIATTSAAINITVTHQNIAPSINWIAPNDLDSTLSNSPITLLATATDADGTIQSVQFKNGSTLLGTITAAPYSIDVVLAPGDYVLTATATDNNGATNSKNISLSVKAPSPTDPIIRKGHKSIIK